MNKHSQNLTNNVGKEIIHESAYLHVTGNADYVDDLPELKDTLHVALGMSFWANAKVTKFDLSRVLAYDGVEAVLTLDDVPGHKYIGAVHPDEPLFGDQETLYYGQPMFAVAARTHEIARKAARLAKIEYEPQTPILTIDDAYEAKSFVFSEIFLRKGNTDEALKQAPHTISSRLEVGGQEQFYLEGQVSYAIPQPNNEYLVYSSTQHPSETQAQIAHVLGIPFHAVTVECRRMGGGFGGKESQSCYFAAVASLMAHKTQKPVKLRLDRDDDFMITGKRHDFRADYQVGFDELGKIRALEMTYGVKCGYSADLSRAVCERQLFSSDNAYHLDCFNLTSFPLKTNTQSNTAFRGFGGPQGIIAIENVIDNIARAVGKDPLDVRYANLYKNDAVKVTPYEMEITDFNLDRLLPELEKRSNYRQRRQEIEQFNRNNTQKRRGIALMPVKFGISFTVTFLNQAGSLIHIYQDGSIMINHGGTEMGQGLHTKICQIVAEVFSVNYQRVKISATNTSKVANTSPTAASTGTDLNGQACYIAANTLKDRLVDCLCEEYKCAAEEVEFKEDHIWIKGEQIFTFPELIKFAYLKRVALFASGYYKTPRIHYDSQTLKGRPAFYFAYAAACSEVEIDCATGESKLLQADILYDAGRSINPAIDRGQIEGGFIQGMGWLTTEELVWDQAGRLLTHAPSTYKIPSVSDCPEVLNVDFWKEDNLEETVYRSKAVGEPPLPLGISVWLAIKDAIAPAESKQMVNLPAPATAEQILTALSSVDTKKVL